LKSRIVGRRQAWRIANRTVDVSRSSASAADHMVMIVANTIFVESRRASWLDAPDESIFGQHSERVVNCLTGNGTDLSAYFGGQEIRSGMRSGGYRPKNGNTLRRDLYSMFAKNFGWVIIHEPFLQPTSDTVKIWTK